MSAAEEAGVDRKRSLSLVAVALIAAGAFCLYLFLSAPEEVPPNILLISIDALRADHLGLYGYERSTSPNVDEVFSQGTVFESAYTVSSKTTPSVISMFTGLLPQNHGIRLLYQRVHPDLITISERLSKAGYQTAGIVSNCVLTEDACQLQTQFEYYDDFVDEKEPYRLIYERGARPTTDAVLRYFRGHFDPQRPFFAWVHYIDPHGPYHPPAFKPVDFTHPEPLPVDVSRIRKYVREPGIDDGLEYIDRYDEEVAYIDAEVGRLLEQLREMGRLEHTLVVFTADHGESMMDHERWFEHSYHVYEELVRVPLAIVGPGFGPARVATPVSLADLAPTLLRAAGVRVPWGLDGKALSRHPPLRNLFTESRFGNGQWRCVIRGHEKWMVQIGNWNDRRTYRYHRYYNLREDPAESAPQDWLDTNRAPARALLRLIDKDPDFGRDRREYFTGEYLIEPKVAPGVASDIGEQATEKLRALGYVE